MTRGQKEGLLIAGGGIAGCLAALAMVRRRPDVPVMLVEEQGRLGNGGHWLFFEREVAPDHRWLLEPLIAASWPGFYTAFPGGSRKLKGECHLITADRLEAAVREALGERCLIGTKVAAVGENELILPGGQKEKAQGALDARGAANLNLLQLGWHKYLSRTYRLGAPHGLDRPVLVDATVEQSDSYRFVRCLPVSDQELIVEDCFLSGNAELDTEAAGGRLDSYVAKRGWKAESVIAEATASLPLPFGGDFDAFWRIGGARVAKLGLRGGFVHPATGYSLADAVRSAFLLTEQKDFGGNPLRLLFEGHAAQLWRKRDVYRSLNAKLFRLQSVHRRALHEALHEEEPGLILRFYAGELGTLDRMKLSKLLK